MSSKINFYYTYYTLFLISFYFVTFFLGSMSTIKIVVVVVVAVRLIHDVKYTGDVLDIKCYIQDILL